MTYDALSVFNTYKSEAEFDAALDELIDRGLLLFDRERGRYDLHPIVRGYAYDRLADKAGVHTRLGDYFAAVPMPEKVESLDDLAPVIELYHHTIRAGRYDEARDLFYARLNAPLYYRLGAYQTFVELQNAFFPDSDFSAKPRLKDEGWWAKLLNDSANCYSLSGQPRHAVPLFEGYIDISRKGKDKVNEAVGLGNLACQQVILGELAAAEQSLRRRIELCREIKDEFREAVGHHALGELLAYQSAFDEAAQELDTALASFSKLGATQPKCVVWAYRAIRALLLGDTKAALEASRKAYEIACSRQNERDLIRAEWLLGAAHRVLGNLPKAETHLTEALTRCRRINLVELEPDILLEMARLRWVQARGDEVTSDESTRLQEKALELAREALAIANRCEYRLKQADIHNFLAQLALERGDREEAREHAEIARERAWCDGPPHCYKPALEEAERILESYGGG